MKYLALLAFVQAAVGAAVTRDTDATRSITLNIVNANLAPDGFTRSTVVANGQYPGPPILANKGDTLRITMNNRLTDPTMRRSTALNLDGLVFNDSDLFEEFEPFVNACPVGPGSSFVYTKSLGTQTGTYWYHSELSTQYVDGFRGPLIVYDPLDPHRNLYDVDDVNTIIQMGDWWQQTTLPLLDNYVATGVVPVSDSVTINGAGRFNGGPAVPWSVINVVKGRRYRFRIINESARNVITVSIDNHEMTVIAADGINTQPKTVTSIQTLAGQRYDVVVRADQPVANYWFNAPFTGGNPAVNPHRKIPHSLVLSSAMLVLPRADPTTPMTAGPTDNTLIEADLRPLVPTPVRNPDVTLTFDLVVTTGKAQWNINGVSYLSPQVPTLEKVLDGATNAGDFNVTENTFILPAGKTVEIIFPATDDDDAHPFHLHGMPMQVIKSMTSNNTNTVNPISRDVVGVGGGGTTIRFTTQQDGPFMFHCHIFWHKFAGLASVQLVDPAGTRKNVHPNQAWEGLCPAYDALPAELQ
ncbi:hypothetical protein NP233_g1764 [Leucocoprinus birnbaumii]|uniref:Laccase n=1 Tax=Leucocoprinus birnbaumii TaxID=56174 RepID=A0AAD5W001_9AGAR|nr:hypothetical protein NP233_g1764 [Leucocoprinus birnbaumii]